MRRRDSALQRLADYGPSRRRRRWLIVAVAALALAGGAAGWYATRTKGASTASPKHSVVSPPPTTIFTIRATSPTDGATSVPSDTTVSIRFSTPLPAAPAVATMPTLEPPVDGSWHRSNRFTLLFQPSAPFVPLTTETLSIPGGPQGVRDGSGATLASTTTISFTIVTGTEERLQQLLALTGYLPLSFSPNTAASFSAAAAMAQAGTFNWRWSGLPVSLMSLWVEGDPSAITTGAVMMLEDQNGLAVDGIAGPKVWSILLDDLTRGTTDQAPYTYVYVSKVLPENLTIWVNGAPMFQGVPVNTGAPGADTTDGTYEVFEHVTASVMKGTNPDGTTYDDPDVPWASFFNGGDALHGFVRATYGSPQSNGCVEMPVATAGATWPYTPIGTLVTVAGPPVT
ncbi:MAG: L,D-transpeptidase family protein [Acidimicrobiales bacterium]